MFLAFCLHFCVQCCVACVSLQSKIYYICCCVLPFTVMLSLYLQISCVSSSTELRNRVRFPQYFQLLSTEETLAFAYFGVIQEYGWSKVVLLVQDENLFTVVSHPFNVTS